MYKTTKTNQQGGDYTPGREARWWQGVLLAVRAIKNNKSVNAIKILDVGCGDGSFLRILKGRAVLGKLDINRFEYYGIDSDIRYKRLIDSQGGHFILGDILDIMKKTKKLSFDLIIASEVIEHVDETDVLIESIKSVLKPNGLIYLTTPNLAAWHSRIMLLFGYQPLATEVSNIRADFGKVRYMRKYYIEPIHHIRVFTYGAMKEFVEYHGLEIVKSFGGGYRWYDSFFFSNILKVLAPVIILLLRNNRNTKQT
ncbi:hypothetical protein COU88_04145 [Candidatus Roizmanbacteria bacterium CG10_big_fil_rev_8_21_14_0_10_39_6]|uniref:Methyltransferase type 11 domain-containing protein n=1 Tax=Candidatus Roizmanbacteria bacterium CG10_big_fil_rev_8_21_14_0_10_39_6 TaxID=1974853 RepID=A0A2M8KRQ5_9BACT|nr:MAG: hypothetical protein COU88_04145 [Candidatus Roizmanbacteria bacterium CG10_big_fil_rev_8_21_14_0_10_39_6]